MTSSNFSQLSLLNISLSNLHISIFPLLISNCNCLFLLFNCFTVLLPIKVLISVTHRHTMSFIGWRAFSSHNTCMWFVFSSIFIILPLYFIYNPPNACFSRICSLRFSLSFILIFIDLCFVLLTFGCQDGCKAWRHFIFWNGFVMISSMVIHQASIS